MTLNIFRCSVKLHWKGISKGINRTISRNLKSGATRNLLARQKTKCVPVRYLKKGPPIRDGQHVKDEIDKAFRLIFYIDSHKIYVYGIPLFYGILVVGLYLTVKVIADRFIYGEGLNQPAGSKTLGRYSVESPLQFAVVGSLLGMFMLVLMIYATKNVVLRMYYNSETGEYAARMLRCGLYRQTIKFTQSDIAPYRSGTPAMMIKGTKVICEEKSFVSLVDYNRFMSYSVQRPSDYEREMEEDSVNILKGKVQENLQTTKSRQFEEKFRANRKERLSKKPVKPITT